jgi:hypothetical protein
MDDANMTDGDLTSKRNERILEIAIDIRKFEIGLFWQRSLFFWGLVGAAFVSYAALRKDYPSAAFLVSCFGLVCSVAWSLANRGSKYWQEYWEREVEKVEERVLGRQLFLGGSTRKAPDIWLAPRMYSVSKLTIALSDFSGVVWLIIAFTHLPAASLTNFSRDCLHWIVFGGSVFYALLMGFKCRSGDRPQGN